MTPNTALVSIGNGIGAGFRNGMVYVLSGPDMARIERERIDGPRYVAAVRIAGGDRRMRANGWHWTGSTYIRADDWRPRSDDVEPAERAFGIPVGWIAR